MAEVRDRLGLGALHVVHRQPRKAGGWACVLLLPMLLASCGIFRPSAEAQCRKAQGYFAKGISICPEAAQLHHDTLHITLPGDSASGRSAMRQEDIDSVAAACSQLSEALAAERTLYEMAMADASHMIIGRQRAVDSLHAVLATSRPAISKLRLQLCPFEPIHDSTALHDLRISWSPSGVLYSIRDFPRDVAIPTTTQEIKSGTVEVHTSVNGWLIGAVIILAATTLVLLLFFISERGMRTTLQDQLQKLKRP